jgi:thiamine pyrophosphate-dependent acetolactate synthase large subunit-like protein
MRYLQTVRSLCTLYSNWSSQTSKHSLLTAVRRITDALVGARKPLVVTSYLGRNLEAVDLLVRLADRLAIPVLSSTPTCVNFPASHPSHVGITYGLGRCDWIREADVILVIDSDVPWMPIHNQPSSAARVFHIDVDPLKRNIGYYHIDAHLRAQVDGATALGQILDALEGQASASIDAAVVSERRSRLEANHAALVRTLDEAERAPSPDGTLTVANIMGRLRAALPERTLWLSESISNYIPVWNHSRASVPGEFHTSGASSLGWALGAAIGAQLGRAQARYKHEFVVVVVGDGSYLFGVPASAFWIARRYNTVSEPEPQADLTLFR